jgi:hypothetical protein
MSLCRSLQDRSATDISVETKPDVRSKSGQIKAIASQSRKQPFDVLNRSSIAAGQVMSDRRQTVQSHEG